MTLSGPGFGTLTAGTVLAGRRTAPSRVGGPLPALVGDPLACCPGRQPLCLSVLFAAGMSLLGTLDGRSMHMANYGNRLSRVFVECSFLNEFDALAGADEVDVAIRSSPSLEF